MPIKHYTTSVPANRSIDEIQQALVKHGAMRVLYEYEQGTGRIDALKFLLIVEGRKVSFALPVNWRGLQAVLKKDQVRRWDEEEYVYRVAWRNIRDCVLSQLALYETQIVDLPQEFLPFATDKGGKTLYEAVQSGNFLLGLGNRDGTSGH